MHGCEGKDGGEARFRFVILVPKLNVLKDEEYDDCAKLELFCTVIGAGGVRDDE